MQRPWCVRKSFKLVRAHQGTVCSGLFIPQALATAGWKLHSAQPLVVFHEFRADSDFCIVASN